METEQWKTVAGDHSVTQIICEHDCSWCKSGDRLPLCKLASLQVMKSSGLGLLHCLMTSADYQKVSISRVARKETLFIYC